MKPIHIIHTMRHLTVPAVLLCNLVLLAGSVTAAPKTKKPSGKTAVPVVELTPTGQALQTKYAGLQQSLKAEIQKQLPAIDASKEAAWRKLIEAEQAAEKEAGSKAGEVIKLQKTEKALKSLEETVQKPPKTYAEAQEDLRQSKAKGKEDPAMAKVLESEQSFQAYLMKEQAKLSGKIDKAKTDAKNAQAALPEAIKTAETAKQAHRKVLEDLWKAMDALGVGGVIGSSQLDGKLAQYTILTEATPRGLAEFAQTSPENEKLIEQLFADQGLMVQMMVADGATAAKYGEAMKIYTDILKASPKAKEGLFQRMAVAVSLGHSVPVVERVGSSCSDKEDSSGSDEGVEEVKCIDPVKRYLSYEKWYLDGELHEGFKDLDVWNLTMALDGRDSDEVFAWGRQMLRNLRPDCIPVDGADTSQYVGVVDKEIYYSSKGVKDDSPDLQVMQNILANGGICGRRAFFGRFILRAYGVPTTARKQPGHATLAHWHPDGWKTRLGGNWGLGARGNYSSMNRNRSSQYKADVNFLASSQAREDAAAFLKVKRAQWIGALVGEEPKLGFISISGKNSAGKQGAAAENVSGFWSELALHEQKRVIVGLQSKKAASTNATSVAVKEPAATGTITVDANGVITIPAAACSSPTQSVRAPYHGMFKDLIVFVKYKDEDTHLHLSRYSTEADSFEYTFDAPKAGKYQLSASVVTAKPGTTLPLSVNGGADVVIPLPFTIGMWDNTAPVGIELKAGKNVLKFHGPSRVTIGKFTLTPVK